MNCYLHSDKSAVGICKYCMKGVCSDCVSIVGASISCKGDCECKVSAINSVQDKQLGMIAFNSISQKLIPFMAIAYGLYVAISWSGFYGFPLSRGLFVMGGVFIAFGLLLLYKTRQKPR